jgi:hypothetical protein
LPICTNIQCLIDREPVRITRPGGQAIVIRYADAGRLATLADDRGTTRLAYDPARGAPLWLRAVCIVAVDSHLPPARGARNLSAIFPTTPAVCGSARCV